MYATTFVIAHEYDKTSPVLPLQMYNPGRRYHMTLERHRTYESYKFYCYQLKFPKQEIINHIIDQVCHDKHDVDKVQIPPKKLGFGYFDM